MNAEMFNEKRKQNGDTIEKLATFIGIERHSLSKKIKGEKQFKLDEMALVATRYKLTPNEMQQIFFT